MDLEEHRSTTVEKSEVDWKNYSPIVKKRIDSLSTAKDCQGLQKEFNSADRNNDAQRNRTGKSNAELMAYLDKLMKKSGCYK